MLCPRLWSMQDKRAAPVIHSFLRNLSFRNQGSFVPILRQRPFQNYRRTRRRISAYSDAIRQPVSNHLFTWKTYYTQPAYPGLYDLYIVRPDLRYA